MPRKGGIELYVISAGQRMSASTVLSVKITKENESRFREESVDIFRVKNAAKRSFLCKDRREFGSLQSTLRDLKKTNETRIKEYEDNKRNLQWVLYNLRHQKTGKQATVSQRKYTMQTMSYMDNSDGLNAPMRLY